MKTAIKETATFAIMIIAFIALAISFTSCSQEDDAKPAFKKDSYTVAVSESATISTGLYTGDFKGTPEEASEYMNAGEIVKSGAIVSVQVSKGETLFVLVDSDKVLGLVVKRNGEELMSFNSYKNGSILIFANHE